MIKYFYGGDVVPGEAAGQTRLQSTWVVLQTKGSPFCGKKDKATRRCEAWLDPWIDAPGIDTVEPRVWSPANHPNAWTYYATKPFVTGQRSIGQGEYDEYKPEGKVPGIGGGEANWPGAGVVFDRHRVPKGWAWPGPTKPE